MGSLKKRLYLLFLTIYFLFTQKIQAHDFSSTFGENKLNQKNNERYIEKIDEDLLINLSPETYDIYLSPYLNVAQNFSYNGIVKLQFHVLNNTNRIVLNYGKITIQSIAATDDLSTLNIVQQQYDETTEKHTIVFDSILKIGLTITIKIEFYGQLTDDTRGFYKKSYKGVDENLKWFAAMQLNKFRARDIFPCFDESEKIPKIRLHILRSKSQMTVTNMAFNITQPTQGEKMVWDIYDSYEPMLPSQIAIFIGDIQSLKIQKQLYEWAKLNSNRKIEYQSSDTLQSINELSNELIKENASDENYRLPITVIPEYYKIILQPHIIPKNFTFDGTVEIKAKSVANSSQIVLHINEIKCHEVKLYINGLPMKITYHIEEKYNFLNITSDFIIPIGSQVDIFIKYTGELNTNMRGFYRSSYIDANNETRWLVATHLEPVGARNMFPCFDEPALKAKFQISVIRSAGYTAISNTDLNDTISQGEYFIDTFHQTPVMSTYLVALVVSDFNSTMINIYNITYQAFARPNVIDQTIYAASIMNSIVDHFQKILNYSYQLRKLDMIALPDFAAGAMENWGLITYRESNMLYHTEHSPITVKQSIASVIVHEISHQWFGNLVSPLWWKYTWLSEGFARYFQYYATAQIESDWGLENQFVVDQLQNSFGIDGVSSSHPMTHDVNSPTEIQNIFDQISYGKGGSVLRMIEKAIGTKSFYEALREYLKARDFQSGTPEQLTEAFEKITNSTEINIRNILNSWTAQAGFPMVTVDMHNESVTLSQKRFLLKNPDGIEIKKLWPIPITYTYKSKLDFSDTTPKFWFETTKTSITLSDIGMQGDDWLIFNIQEAGYYRVNYDAELWYRIIRDLQSKNFTKINEVNRAALMDDVLNLARAGETDYFHALFATQYLTQETNYIPWKAAFNGLSYLNKQFRGKAAYELFKIHILTILTPIYNKLGFNEIKNDSHYDKLLRRNVINWACEFGIKDCIDNSLKLFKDWRLNASKLVPANLRTTIYCTAIKYGTLEDYHFLWNKYLTTDVPAEKNVIISALGCSNNATLLEELLMSAINLIKPFRRQDIPNVFSSVYTAGLFGAQTALEFVMKHYNEMLENFDNYDDIESIIGSMSTHLSTKSLVNQLQEFVESIMIKFPTTVKSLNSFVTLTHEELTWYDKNSPRIIEWLDTIYPSSDYRLPKSIVPITYKIFLMPHLENNEFTFDGSVTIEMNINENITKIVLHAHTLTVKDIEVSTDNENLYISSYSINSTTDKLTIYLDKTVSNMTTLTVTIQYSGILNDKMIGFYRSYYKDDYGNIHWLASTQFQKFGARQAFPCFDEPSFKAQFSVNIERPNHYHTLSNMPLRSQSPSGKENYTLDHYMKSEPMSSYLVAFIVSDFVPLLNEIKNFRIWSRPNANLNESAKNALEIGQKALSFLEDYTRINYPISKMDLVAIPDFAAGAMENWGLVTFREYGLLTLERITSAVYMRYMATTIAHELVHMWFGDLVTCDWWEYLWLNEGFAEYLEYLVIDSIYPEWNMKQHFISYELQHALLRDSFPYMRPMNNKMETPMDEGKDFTSVVYAKAASVIHMMHRAFGEKIFAEGLHTYLDRNKYGTGKPEYLWSALQARIDANGGLNSTSKSVATLMESWTNQPGYPVVHANLSGNNLTLTQERFLVTGKNTSHTQLYWIPITIATKTTPHFDNASTILWFGEPKTTIDNVQLNNEWFILNVQQAGYYRVNYEVDNWNKLIVALNEKNFGGIPAINRAQIIDDILNLARAELVSYDLAFIATQYMAQELHHLPWKAFFTAYAYMHERFASHDVGNELQKYVLKLTDNVYKHLDFNEAANDTQLMKTNRQLILSWNCKLNQNDCVESAKKLFSQWRNDTKTFIVPDAKPAVICTALEHGSYEDWSFAWEQYKLSNLESDKVVILNALGCTKNTTAINMYLEKIFSRDGSIRDQNVATAFASIYSAGKFGGAISLEFLMKNYTKIYEYYGNWESVANLFSNVATKFSTEDDINKLQRFVNETSGDLNNIKTSLNRAIIAAKTDFEFLKKHGTVIQSLLTTPTTTNNNEDGNSSGGNGNFYKINFTVSILMAIITVLVTTCN